MLPSADWLLYCTLVRLQGLLLAVVEGVRAPDFMIMILLQSLGSLLCLCSSEGVLLGLLLGLLLPWLLAVKVLAWKLS